MHLAPVADVAEVLIVCHEGDASRPEATCARQREASRHDGTKPVRSDDERRLDGLAAAVRMPELHTGHTPVRVPLQIDDARALAHLGPRAASAVEQNGIEDGATEREAAITKGAIAMLGDEIAAQRGAIWRTNDHSREMRRPRAFHGVERAHLAQESRGLRAQILGAGLGSGKGGAVEHEHTRAGAGERKRRRCASGSSANDDRVVPAFTGAAANAHAVKARGWPTVRLRRLQRMSQ